MPVSNKYNSLKKEIEEKNKLLALTGLKSIQNSTFYSDFLAHSLQKGIILTELNFQPVELNRSDADILLFKYKEIWINGICTSSLVLNDWIKILKSEKWVDKIVISNYIHDPEKAKAIFNLDIYIK